MFDILSMSFMTTKYFVNLLQMTSCTIKKNNSEISYSYRLELYTQIKKENLKNIYSLHESFMTSFIKWFPSSLRPSK